MIQTWLNYTFGVPVLSRQKRKYNLATSVNSQYQIFSYKTTQKQRLAVCIEKNSNAFSEGVSQTKARYLILGQ